MRSTPGTHRRVQWFMALVLFLVLPTLMLAQHAAKSNGNGKGPDSDESIGTAGQQVAVDSATGKLRQPTREEVMALVDGLQAILNQSTQGLQATYHPDGSVSVDLEDRFENAAIAKINPDGSISQTCVNTV